jgi:hypothetical protein
MLGSQDSSLRADLQANALQPQQPVVPASIPDQSPLGLRAPVKPRSLTVRGPHAIVPLFMDCGAPLRMVVSSKDSR